MGPWSYVYEAFDDAGVENDYLLQQIVNEFKSMHNQIVGLKKGMEYDTHHSALQEEYSYLRIEYDNVSLQLDELLKAQEKEV